MREDLAADREQQDHALQHQADLDRDTLAGQPLERYAGTYRNAYVGTAEVITAGNGLQLLLGPDRLSRPLTSLGQHRFSYAPIGENNTGPSAVTFTLGPDGRPTTVRIDNLNSHGMGTLQRLREQAAGPPG